MQLGFVSAILPDYSLEQVLSFASEAGFASVELMAWPPGKAERRYAGVTHLDASDLSAGAIKATHDLLKKYGVEISGVGYYPNALSPVKEEADTAQAHILKVIDLAAALGVGRMNTFIGRDWTKSVDDNWPRFLEVWRPIIDHADAKKVKVGIENCPMSFGKDEWPGGKNLAHSPAIWRRMFADIPSPNFGLNYDPSHLVLQQMDYIAPLAEFKDRIHHAHAKDLRIDRAKLNQVGVFAHPNSWHSPKLPGQGDVNWGAFLGALADAGYKGHLAIEVEDRAYEGTIEDRKDSLIISRRYLEQFIIGKRGGVGAGS
ncbi:sugar phosphate isomerase/epimerase family protein [Paludisphaera rhizosphaerae]|uniref:sugar phosphate isomerase/epimerase family protein n=1 Tax=Paludisphaera rhizosphaerae TaxID=2711216 RepID=UPI0013E9A06A|nr:sugar phosphate isomerase/epimerase [Paludisphaera rhizosphaerae]